VQGIKKVWYLYFTVIIVSFFQVLELNPVITRVCNGSLFRLSPARIALVISFVAFFGVFLPINVVS